MPTKPFSEIIARGKVPKAKRERIIREAHAEVLQMELRELRKASGKTQVQVAAAAKMTQGDLSKAEQRSDHLVSTLRRIVHALGGELEIRAVFEKHSVRLQ